MGLGRPGEDSSSGSAGEGAKVTAEHEKSVAPRGDEAKGAGAGEGPGSGGRVRYSRRRFLAIAGAVVAAFAGLAELLRRLFGGEGLGGAVDDMFGPFPVRSVEDVPDVPADEWVLEVDGLVEEPVRLDRTVWATLTRFQETVDFNCVEGWTVDDVRWGGVAPAQVLARVRPRPSARYAVFHAYGGEYSSSLPLDLVRHEQSLLADTLDGQPLPPKHGGPLRLVVPVQLGYKSVKWVSRIELTDRPVRGYWEERGYPQDAPVTGSLPNGGGPPGREG